MSIADKLQTIAENEQKVYDAGVEVGNAETDLKHWEMLTSNGKRTHWNNFLSGTDYTGCTFPKPIKISGSSAYELSCLFYNYTGKYLPEGIDLSGVAENLNMYNGTWFTWSTKLIEIPDMGLPAINWTGTVSSCNALKKVEKLRFNGKNKGLAFSCPKLEEIGIEAVNGIEGAISQNVSLSGCPLLTYKTLKSIIDNLKDYSEDTSGTTHTLNIGSTNIAKLSQAELESVEQKGWEYK